MPSTRTSENSESVLIVTPAAFIRMNAPKKLNGMPMTREHGVPAPDEEEEGQRDEDDAEDRVPLEDLENVADLDGRVVPDLEAHVLREPLLVSGDGLPDVARRR